MYEAVDNVKQRIVLLMLIHYIFKVLGFFFISYNFYYKRIGNNTQKAENLPNINLGYILHPFRKKK